MASEIVQNGRDWLDYATLVATLGGVAIVALYTWYTKRLVELTRKALEAAEKNNAENSRLQREATTAANRAWVGPDMLDAAVLTPGFAGLRVILRNFGRFPAKNIVGRSERRYVNKLSEWSFPDPPLGSAPSIAILFPTVPGGTILGEGAAPITEEEVREVEDKRKFLYYCGVFTYDNGIGATGETRFCAYYNADMGTWDFAPFGADAT